MRLDRRFGSYLSKYIAYRHIYRLGLLVSREVCQVCDVEGADNRDNRGPGRMSFLNSPSPVGSMHLGIKLISVRVQNLLWPINHALLVATLTQEIRHGFDRIPVV